MPIAKRLISPIGMAGIVTIPTFFGAVLFVGFGNGLTLPSANAGVLPVRPELAGSASGFSGALTVGGGAVPPWAMAAPVTKGDAAFLLLGILLACALAGLLCALWVREIDRREGR